MSLDEARAQIDLIDQQLIRLLNQRAELVQTIGNIKRKDGLDVYVPGREEKLLRKLTEINLAQQGHLTERAIRSIYREIMSASLALESAMKIAYLGPQGSWTHQVAINKFGNSVGYIAEPSIQGVFHLITSGQADYGVLPIEHSTEGTVHHTLDQLMDSPLQIYAEIHWKAETVVMATSPNCPVHTIHGHPQILAQCRSWLSSQFPQAQLLESPTSGQAASAAQADPTHAALGTPVSAELHQLKILSTSPPQNATLARFIILGTRCGSPTGQDNTMLMVQATDQIGSLLEILKIFATHQVNVRQIENRPLHQDSTTQARFFLEISGHIQDPAIQNAITDLRHARNQVKPLGSYPAPTWIEER